MTQALAGMPPLDRRSQAERDWESWGPAILAGEYGDRVQVMQYEPCTWHIPGGKYTPDFMAIMQSGRIIFIEVKGTRKLPSYRDSRAKLRAAAAIYPWFTWLMVTGKENNWNIEEI